MAFAVMDVYEALRNAKDDDERARVIARALEAMVEEISARVPVRPASAEELHATEQALREEIQQTRNEIQQLCKEMRLAELRLRKEKHQEIEEICLGKQEVKTRKPICAQRFARPEARSLAGWWTL